MAMLSDRRACGRHFNLFRMRLNKRRKLKKFHGVNHENNGKMLGVTTSKVSKNRKPFYSKNILYEEGRMLRVWF